MSIIPSQTKVYSGFDPRTIPGCQLWLDAADTSSLTLSGSSVTAWRDKSGNGSNITVTGTITYNSSDKYVQTSTTSYFSTPTDIRKTTVNNLSVFLIYQWLGFGLNGNEGLWGSPGGGWNRFQILSFPVFLDAQWGLAFGNTSPFVAKITALNTSSTVLYCAQFAYNVTNGSFMFLNGSQRANFTDLPPSPDATNAITTFGNYGNDAYLGRIAFKEIIFYNTSLTTAQRQQVEGYLARKWGLTTNLPATHPFKLTPIVTRPFQPTDIENCRLWLDAADASSLTLSGSNVTQWRDKSGTGLVLAQGTNAPTLGPLLNNSQTIQFTTTQSMLSTGNYSSTPTQTWFLVFNAYNNTNNNRFFLAHSGADISVSNGEYFYGGNGTLWAQYRTPNSRTVIDSVGLGTTPFNSAQWYITNFTDANTTTDTTSIGFRIDGTDRTISYHTGGNVIVSGTYSVPLRINTAAAANNYIAEIIIYNAALTKTQIQQIEGYLANKWGLRRNLPSTHSFKLVPPLSVPFNPVQLSNCSVWLDGADPSYMTLSGTSVTVWQDKSGNARNFTASGAAANYNGGLTGLLFNSNIYTSSFSAVVTNETLFTVFKPTSDISMYVLASSVNGGRGVGTFGSASRYGIVNANVAWGSVTGSQLLGTNSVNIGVTVVSGGNSTQASANGNSLPTATTFSAFSGSGTTQLGMQRTNESPFYGTIYEIVGYSRVLTTSEIQQVEGYLASKWIIQANLPTTHPYKKITP